MKGFDVKPKSLTQERRWEVVAAFAFGCVFVIVILTAALFIKDPSPLQYTIFRIVIALAAAGVGAVLPGFLDISFKNWLRAGGALALFVVVYFFAPAAMTPVEPKLDEPKSDAKPTADSWLSLVDAGQYTNAYSSMAEGFKKNYPFNQFQEIAGRDRTGLGTVKGRNLFSSQKFVSPPGYPKGHYSQYMYATTFEHDARTVYQLVWLSVENQEWRVSGFYNMVKNITGQLVPYEPK